MIDWLPLQKWFTLESRELPWREMRTPYRVWVSEIMLQQTQVSVVVPYFERWMQLFPTIEALANATREDVIKAWEGLGYYSRARNLHEGAIQVAKEFQGRLPDTSEELIKIKGIGAYTVGAICSFAFGQRVAAVDGNVLRVLARVLAVSDDIAKPKTQSLLRERLQSLLPDNSSGLANEALIELGAVVCKKQNPDCARCPLKTQCQAYRSNRVEEFPVKSKPVKTEKLFRTVVCVLSECGHYLVKRGEKGQIMQDLFEFPFFEAGTAERPEVGLVLQKMGLAALEVKALDVVEHSFTRYRATLWPFLIKVKEVFEVKGCQWIAQERLLQLPFSSGHRRVLGQLVGLPKDAKDKGQGP